jgi:hypothetical protein
MITGFEDITEPLSEAEMKLVPVIAKGLRARVGRANAISASAIESRMAEHGYKVPGARLRKIVNHIRVHGVVPLLLASSAGYYVCDDTNEAFEYLQSLYDRERAMTAMRKAIQVQLEEVLGHEIPDIA